jgi:2-aminobenzoate-CoA ligase
VGDTPLRSVIPLDNQDDGLLCNIAAKSATFSTVPTSSDDACLIAFTSGTTGEPKATVHFHRDILAMCVCFAKHALDANSESIFSGSPPIGFTYGLGALLIFPLYFGASVALPEAPTALGMVEAIQQFRVTHLFTAPTAYKQMQHLVSRYDLSSLQICVSAGEALPAAISESWFNETGVRIIDGIGSTEMIHIFISSRVDKVRPGATGKPIPGYRVALFNEGGRPFDGPGVGRLAVQGPTGCRYLSDSRQRDYVVDGWNLTGDLYRRDPDGYYWHVARVDDMIVSSGYNIAGPEVEGALMLHPDVQECAVVGWPDEERGQIVKAVIVPRRNVRCSPDFARALQEHVKRTLAPYKYPRCVEFCESLPKTATGKLRRSALRVSSGIPRQETIVGALLRPLHASVQPH